MTTRPYDRDRDEADVWALKRAFELGIGSETGGDEKHATYVEKLTDEYRARYLDWVDWCCSEDDRSVTVATGEDGLLGYVFVLPEQFAFIWDGAVLNELYVVPAARGTGVADELMEAALEYAADMSLPLDRMVLDVDRENPRARAFYDRYGFDHWGEMVATDLAGKR